MGFFSSIFCLLGAQSPVHIRLLTLLSGAKKIGSDSLGNVYYEHTARSGYNHPRRWVLYKGAPEPSSVPPEWHGWLHYQTNSVPENESPSFRQPWQLPPQENLTGTSRAYHPPGHLLSGGSRAKATGDYEPWTPPR